MIPFVTDIRAMPLWLLREYLVELGGQAGTDNQVTGPGWQVTLTQLEDYRIGSLRVGEVRLEFSGTEPAVAQLQTLLAPKLARGGG
ncbi:MAG: DUF1952 domain-containing protein [Chloroflexi bacterium]|nr:DUF1952 domain-containing protein [Chloroflexota bacterium]